MKIMKKAITLLLVIALSLVQADPSSASEKSDIDKALKYYKKGNIQKALKHNNKLPKKASRACIKKLSEKEIGTIFSGI